jgi:hypothetical protein
VEILIEGVGSVYFIKINFMGLLLDSEGSQEWASFDLL